MSVWPKPRLGHSAASVDPRPSTERAQETHVGRDAGARAEQPSPVPACQTTHPGEGPGTSSLEPSAPSGPILAWPRWPPHCPAAHPPHLQAVLALAEPAVGPGGTAPVLHGLESPRKGDLAAPERLRDSGTLYFRVHLAGLPEAVLRVGPAHGPDAQRRHGVATTAPAARPAWAAEQGAPLGL